MKLWQKNTHQTGSDASKRAERFTVGNDYLLDMTLLPYDIKASKVHANSLGKAGILTQDEVDQLNSALDEILNLWQKQEFIILPEHEDGHTALEAWLTEHLGDVGGKIHTGRSRNDQVITALRLYERAQLTEVENAVNVLVDGLLQFGKMHEHVLIPGFTHTRKAMLSGVKQWAGGYAELLCMQLEAGAGVKSLTGRSPLGTAAGFGSTIDLDREAQAKELGFDRPMASATTAQLSRGWVEWQLSVWLAGITAVLAKLASDCIRFSSQSHGFFEMEESVCTGSSIMPQKKNPDVAELIRGKHAVVLGQVSILQNLCMNLESGYHRDLQLTKEPIITAFETTLDTLDAAELLVSKLSVNTAKAEAACTPELLAAEAANLLVIDKKISFREAYKTVAENPEYFQNLNPKDIMKRFTQLGSPGNVADVR